MAACLSHAGCRRDDHRGRADAGVTLTWALRPSTATVGPATLMLSLRRPDGVPIAGATVRVDGHMTHPGMAPVTAEATERPAGAGSYEARFAFTMPGDWVLIVSAALPDGTRVERRIDVGRVRAAG
jgi:hypothetical protein